MNISINQSLKVLESKRMFELKDKELADVIIMKLDFLILNLTNPGLSNRSMSKHLTIEGTRSVSHTAVRNWGLEYETCMKRAKENSKVNTGGRLTDLGLKWFLSNNRQEGYRVRLKLKGLIKDVVDTELLRILDIHFKFQGGVRFPKYTQLYDHFKYIFCDKQKYPLINFDIDYSTFRRYLNANPEIVKRTKEGRDTKKKRLRFSTVAPGQILPFVYNS